MLNTLHSFGGLLHAEPTKAWTLLVKVFYLPGNILYVPTRWTKVAPPIRFWAAGLAVHGALQEAFIQSDALLDWVGQTIESHDNELNCH